MKDIEYNWRMAEFSCPVVYKGIGFIRHNIHPTKMKKTTKNKLLVALNAVGPGLFLIGYNIGTGSVTTMAKAGAEHGMTLLWAIIVSCLFTANIVLLQK